MLQMKIQTTRRRYVTPGELPAVLGTARAREELGELIDYLFDQLNLIDGDPDLETDTSDLEGDMSDFEPEADGMGDPSWCEWHSLAAPTRKAGWLNGRPVDSWRANILEDDEEDDVAEMDDEAGDLADEDNPGGYRNLSLWDRHRGPGCPISDPGGAWDSTSRHTYMRRRQALTRIQGSHNSVR